MGWGDGGSERLSDLTQLTQLLSARARTGSQVFARFPSCGFNHCATKLPPTSLHSLFWVVPKTSLCWPVSQSCPLGWVGLPLLIDRKALLDSFVTHREEKTTTVFFPKQKTLVCQFSMLEHLLVLWFNILKSRELSRYLSVSFSLSTLPPFKH